MPTRFWSLARLVPYLLPLGVLLPPSAASTQARGSAPAPTPDEFRQKLAAYDSAFLSGLTVSGSFRSSGTSKQGKEIHFTCAGQRCALREVRLPPPYQKPAKDAKPDSNRSYEGGNLRLLSGDDKVLHLFDEQKSARIETNVEYLIAPDGTILEQKDKYNLVVYYPPDSITLVRPKLRVLWTLGRGFSAYLKKVTAVKPAEGGLLRVTGGGVSMEQAPGEWVLLVDPQLGYLVREASFRRPGEKKPGVIIRNAGLQAEQTCLYPKEGSFTFDVGGWPVTYQVTFEAARLKLDEGLYDSVERVFAGPPPPSTRVHDNRVAPRSERYINPEGKVSGEGGQAPPPGQPAESAPTSRLHIFLVVNLAILAGFGVWWYVRIRHRQPAPAP